MFEVGLPAVCEEINEAFGKGNLQRVDALLWPALDQFSDLPQLWFYAGNLSFKLGKAALAAQCFERCIELDENPLVLANLGAAYRKMNLHEAGLAVLRQALERDPDYEPALVNYGAMFVNEGCPQDGIPSLERAVELGRAKGKCETGAEWNLGLLYLEAARFGQGFDLYRGGYGAERLVRNYGYGDVPEPERLELVHHQIAKSVSLANQPRKTLIVHGEQGIGDELMFATIINDAIYDYDIVFECHPRLEKLHRNSTWARQLTEQNRPVRIYPTRKDTHISWPQSEGIRADYKCAIADLGAYYRRNTQSFFDAWNRNGPTYAFRQYERDSYRIQLEAMAQGRPIVGLATHGGVLTTARQYRTLKLPEIEQLFARTDCLFIGLDYDDMTPFVFHLHEKFPGRYHWPTAVVQHWDYDHTAALLAATDMNVLVCQSAAHLSAGIGAQTRVLAPKRTAWREILLSGHGDAWYWWPSDSTALYMQENSGDWSGPINRVIEDIAKLGRA